MLLAVVIAGLAVGSAVASRLARATPPARLAVRANLVSLAGAFVFLVAVLSGHLSVRIVLSTMFAFTFGVGIAGPAALTMAISVDRRIVGSASGFYGFTQMTIGAICTAAASIGPDPALAASTVLFAAGCVGQVSFAIANAIRSACVGKDEATVNAEDAASARSTPQ